MKRAIYLAENNGITAISFNAKDFTGKSEMNYPDPRVRGIKQKKTLFLV